MIEDMQERAVLARVDARGRQAAAALTTAIARVGTPTVVADRDEAGAVRPAYVASNRQSATPAGTMAGGVAGPPPTNRRGWLVAAVVMAVAGLVAANVASSGPDGEDVVSGATAEGTFLVPDWLPEGWSPFEGYMQPVPGLAPAPTGLVAAYGDQALDDPWSGPQLVVSRDHSYLSHPNDGTPVTVAGIPATLVDGAGWGMTAATVVEWTSPDGTVMAVLGFQVSRDAILLAAEHTTGDPAIGAGGLPSGFAELARGPVTGSPGLAGDFGVGLVQTFGVTPSPEGQLVILQQPGDADDADLFRIDPGRAQPTEIRGQVASMVVIDEIDEATIQWYEPTTGMVVRVRGTGLDADQLRQVAESLRPATPGDIDDVLRRRPPADGEVVVASGDVDGVPWELVAQDERTAFGLRFVTPRDDEGSSLPKDAGGWAPLHDLVAGQMGGVVPIYGAARPDLARIEVTGPDGIITTPELRTVDLAGWPGTVFVAFVPVDRWVGVEVVGYDASGRAVVISSLAGS